MQHPSTSTALLMSLHKSLPPNRQVFRMPCPQRFCLIFENLRSPRKPFSNSLQTRVSFIVPRSSCRLLVDISQCLPFVCFLVCIIPVGSRQHLLHACVLRACHKSWHSEAKQEQEVSFQCPMRLQGLNGPGPETELQLSAALL